MSHLPLLPPELWINIFRWATITPLTSSLCTTTYQPFHSTAAEDRDHTLAVKYALVCVCRLWRDLAIDLLYEDLLILRQHAGNLRQVLEGGSEDEAGLRKRVRRVCLPYSSSVPQIDTAYPTDAISILRRCPSLEVLVRPSRLYGSPTEVLLFDYLAEPCPPLLSLKRLDWWHRNDATRTGGINRLPDVIQAAPNLQYLSLEGEVGLSLIQLQSSIELPALATLHIRRINMLYILQISQWTFPSLRHLIIDGFTNIYMLQTLISSFGAQLRTLEFGKTLKCFVNDALHPFLEGCPNLEELNYYVFFTRFPNPLCDPHESLRIVGLHGATNPLYTDSGEPQIWEHLEAHIEVLCLPTYPSLRRIVLYGDWSHIRSDPRYEPLEQRLKDRGCAIDVHIE